MPNAQVGTTPVYSPVYSDNPILPEIRRIVLGHFAKVSGMEKEPFVNIRVRDHLIIYVFVNALEARDAGLNLAFPPDVGITYENPANNTKKMPRLWLEERLAELRCERDIGTLCPNLKLEFVTFICHVDGRVTPLPN